MKARKTRAFLKWAQEYWENENLRDTPMGRDMLEAIGALNGLLDACFV